MTTPVQLGRFVLLSSLATGGMGEVFLARQRSLVGNFDRLVAIKLLLSSYSRDPAFVNMFLDEARVTARLNHPNIVQVFDVGCHEQQYYIVMEYIAGESLHQILRLLQAHQDALPLRLACDGFADLARALNYAHESSEGTLIHRDVTLSNIIISDQGIVKLIDFGIARGASRVTTTRPGTLKGKFAYMAPEYLSGNDADHRSDLYSLGVVMYETIARRRLFRGVTPPEIIDQVLRADYPAIEKVVPGIAPSLAAVVAKALALEPDQRFQSGNEFADALCAVSAEIPSPFETPTLGRWMDRCFRGRIAARALLARNAMALRSVDLGPGAATSRPSQVQPDADRWDPEIVALPSSNHASASVLNGEKLTAHAIPQPRRGRLVFGVAIASTTAALLLSAVVAVTRRAQLSPTPAASLASPPVAAPRLAPAPPADEEGLARSHRTAGLVAMEVGQYARAVKEFTEAGHLKGAGADVPELLRIAIDVAALTSPKHADPADDSSPLPLPRRKIASSTPHAGAPPHRGRPASPAVLVEPPRAPATEGTLLVTSSPTALDVEVDGNRVGLTPARLSIAPGVHSVAIFHGGRQVYSRRVDVTGGGLHTVDTDLTERVAGQSARAAAETVSPSHASLPAPAAGEDSPPPPPPARVASRPPTAPASGAAPPKSDSGELLVLSPNVYGDVWINGKPFGHPPLVAKQIPSGRALVEIRVDGTVRRSRTVDVPGNAQRLPVRFE